MSGTLPIEELLRSVSLWRGRRTAVSPLAGGLTNANYLVEDGGARYVLRVPGRATELLAIDRANERHNAEAASATGVAPRVLEYLPERSVMVLEFIDGETMTAERLRSPAMARRMAASIKRLHAGRRFLRDFDMFALTDTYLEVCRARGIAIPDGFADRLAQVGEIRSALGRRPLPTVPCHNDLLAENYIDDGAQLWIVDYEYSGNNDPCFELGDTAQECGFDQDLRAVLCEAYFGEAPPALLARMNLQALMADVGWTLWAAIQARVSTIEYDFWGWATERWDRALAAFDSREFARWLRAAAAG